MNLNSIKLKIELNLANDAACQKLKDIIIKKGGRYWAKNGRRVYFCRDMIDDLYDICIIDFPISHLYFDMSDKCFRFEIGEGDYKKYNETIVKNAIINSLKNRG